MLSDPLLPNRLKHVAILRVTEKRILMNASQLARHERDNMILQLDKLKLGIHSSIEHTEVHGDEPNGIENETTKIENESDGIGNESSGLGTETVIAEECSEPSLNSNGSHNGCESINHKLTTNELASTEHEASD